MKRFISIRTIAIAAAASMAFAASASAYDDDDYEPAPGDAVIGIIGQVIGNAIERKQENSEFRRQCRRWQERCEDGREWACERYENECE